MACILDLNSLGPEQRDAFVFYASSSFIIYKSDVNIDKSSCDGSLLSRFPCPVDYHYYDFAETPNGILFMLGGKTLAFIGHDNSVLFHDISPSLGVIVTKIYAYDGYCIFGTRLANRVQFIKYDYKNKARMCQTSSWPMAKINDTIVYGNLLYALLDNALLVCCDMSNGQTLWTRVETSLVNKNLLLYKGKLLYCNQGLLKIVQEGKSQNRRIPFTLPTSLFCEINDNLYYLCNNGLNMACYNLHTSTLAWEIEGNVPIDMPLRVRGKQSSIDDVALIKIGDDIAFVNLTYGKMIYTIPRPNIKGFRETADHVLIHKHDGTTELLPGIKK
jgi:outer membrane protein assembly factor BamB